MRFLQPTMSGGELSPGLHGRTDLVRYATSLKTCRNVITKPTGGVAKRPGLLFRGEVKHSDRDTRIIAFVYSTLVKYLIEMGDGYMRFWVNGALLRDSSGNIVEVTTPYTGTLIYDVRFTQSADVLYLVHPQIPPKELRRLSATSFEMRDYAFRRGPFRPFNTDEAAKMAVSAVQGVVTVTANVPAFTVDMIGSLLYLEEKELRSVKPWVAAEKNVPVGALRRSDSKVYRCVSVPTNLGTKGSDRYYVCGGVRPVHDVGRAFDGPQDIKDDGVNSYAVGVEWEYVHGGFGLVQITAYTDQYTVTGTVIERIPDGIVGTVPPPAAGPWTFDGDGTTLQFSIPGASSASYLDYTVTIDGVPVQSNPYYPGGSGTGGTSTGGIGRSSSEVA
ncbi:MULTISPECIES: hypothetical protein [unclassified Xanthomonas]|uniref:hypothetical protein n=1 Tax=unclassified Xanthomonas TaxID=2643310 RepID=UPI002A82B1D8|nr:MULTISPECIES: hypothetical protein [unclassified Xanthomonas]MDY4297516.1 hypothetical protein [Xanthomonas sp. LF02-5]MDY4359310.1 hypothetical protein [Xanthomonas sp. LF04-12]